MKNIHELEEDLYKRWLKSYPDDEQKEFCFDGLCYNGKISSDGKNASPGDEEELWNNTRQAHPLSDEGYKQQFRQ
ncbi:hypothetical protein QMY64_18985 [Phocaeicola dorei]|nr:hypothetical protein QMY64_18985 [Phocaeicola dorei]